MSPISLSLILSFFRAPLRVRTHTQLFHSLKHTHTIYIYVEHTHKIYIYSIYNTQYIYRKHTHIYRKNTHREYITHTHTVYINKTRMKIRLRRESCFYGYRNGVEKQAIGEAFISDPSKPAQLSVRFTESECSCVDLSHLNSQYLKARTFNRRDSRSSQLLMAVALYI